jgi:hypothetical protein
MKFTALAFATLATLASARDFNLRAAANRLLGGESSDPADARIIVHGLLNDASAEDLKIISKSAVAAYNSAYSAAGHSLTALKTKISIPVPDKVGIWSDCRWCSSDDAVTLADSNTQGELVFVEIMTGGSAKHDAATSLQTKAFNFVNFEDIHKTFEDDFCWLLRVSGSANLANARDCSFSFLETPGKSELVPSESAYASTNGDATEAQVIIHGTLHDFTKKEFSLINKSIILAYSEAYTNAGYTISEFEASNVIDMPETGCMMVNAAKMVFARIRPGSTPDDDNTAVVLKDSQIAFMHDAFEKAFCTKLQNSGLANFASAHDCSFRFVYSPVGGAESAQQ